MAEKTKATSQVDKELAFNRLLLKLDVLDLANTIESSKSVAVNREEVIKTADLLWGFISK